MNDLTAFITQRLEDVHFETLLNDALDAITVYGGDQWTDLGEHDPGVTMVQALAFVAADLCYRNTLPLDDLLTPEPSKQASGLFPLGFGPESALTCSPVTEADYRRGILDLFNSADEPFFRNVRVEREPVAERFTYFYSTTLRAFLFDDIAEATTELKMLGNLKIFAEPMRGQDSQAALEALASYLTQHRNIGEGVGTIDLMQSATAEVFIDVELADDVSDPARVMANIFTATDQFLSPAPTRSSASTLRSAGIANDQIYTGPRLQHGWITDLPPNEDYATPNIVNFTPLVNRLLAIDGVASLQYLSLARDNQTWDWTRPAGKFGWVWSEDPIAVLASGDVVRLFKKGQQLRPSAADIAANLQRTPLIVDLPTTLPYGRYRAPGRYFSITTRLPEIYGMLSLDPSPPARHLYQFLLTFEQMLANAADQLAMLPRTLSFERNVATRQWGGEWPYAQGTLPGLVNAAYSVELKRYINNAAFDADKELETIDYLLGYFGSERAPRTLELPQDEFIAVQQGILRQFAEYTYNRANLRVDQVSALQRRIAARLGFGSELFTGDQIDLSRLPFYIVEHRSLLPRQPNPDYEQDQLVLTAELVTSDEIQLLRITATRDPQGIQLEVGQAVALNIRMPEIDDGYLIELQMIIGIDGGTFDLSPADSRLLQSMLPEVLEAAADSRLYWRNSNVWLKDMEYPLFLDPDQSDLSANQYRIQAAPYPTNLIAGNKIRVLPGMGTRSATTSEDDFDATVLSADPLFHRVVIETNAPISIPPAGYYWYVIKPINDRFSLQASFVFDLNLVQGLAEPYATAAWIAQQVRAETPAHVQPVIQWLPSAEYENFGAIYDEWQNSGQPLGDLSYELVYWLSIGMFPYVRAGIGTMVVATPQQREAVVGPSGEAWDEEALKSINPVHVPPLLTDASVATNAGAKPMRDGAVPHTVKTARRQSRKAKPRTAP